jgi:hypothetical protein
MAFSTVPVGRYYGWTSAEIAARIAVIKAAAIARPVGFSVITSVAGNGTSASFDTRGAGSVTLEEELYDLQCAAAMLDDDAPEMSPHQVFAA